MTSAIGSEDRPAYDVLARKTVEILDLVNSTRQLLIEQYNNDQMMWQEAMFRILMWKNQVFVQEERKSSATDPNVHKLLRDHMLEMFRAMDEQTPDSVFRGQLFETGRNFISTFRVFTNFLLQSKVDAADELANLQYIAKNIEKYVQKRSENLEKAEPEKGKSPNEQKMKTACELEPANESKKAKPVENEPPKVKPASEPPKMKSSEPQKLKPIGSEIGKGISAFSESPKMKPATSKRDINEETFGSEATQLAFKDSVVVGEKRSTTPAKMGANDQLCEICNDPITIFNYDKEFSLTLHEGEPNHKRAVKKKLYAMKEASPAESVGNTKEQDVQRLVIDLVGEAQARYFQIVAGDEFFCTACKCCVCSTYNVVTHVQGRNHMKNTGFKSQESKESKSSSDSRDVTSDEIDSSSVEDDTVFRTGIAIPVRSLF